MDQATVISTDAPISTKGATIGSPVLTVVGLLYLYQALKLPLGDPLGTGIGAIPVLVAVCWVAFGLLATIRSRSTSVDLGPWPAGRLALRVGYAFLLCVAFIITTPFFGIFLTTAVFLLLMARLDDASWKNAIILGVVTPLVFWLVFKVGLKLSLPFGSLLTSFLRG